MSEKRHPRRPQVAPQLDARKLEAQEIRDRRTRDMVSLVVNGGYQHGVTPYDLAEQWEISASTVRDIYSEALRTIRLGLDPEKERQELSITCDRLVSVALNKEGMTGSGLNYPDPDVKAAAMALKLKADVLGLIIKRHQITKVEEIRAELAAKTDEEIEAELVRMIEQHRGGNGHAAEVH